MNGDERLGRQIDLLTRNELRTAIEEFCERRGISLNLKEEE